MFHASSTDPLLGAGAPVSAAPGSPDAGSTPCTTSLPTCVLTAQYNNSRTSGTAETVFMTSNLAGNLQLLAQFQVDTTHLLQGFTNNPVYAQPLYVSGLPSIGNPPATHNVVFVTTLNGEVYAFDADNTATPTKLWYRDETNTVSMQGLKHNCDVPSFPGQSLSGPLPYLDFAGVVSTPVVELDPTTGNPYAIYVANLCQKTSDNSEHWWLNALNLQTGATLGTVEIAYTSAQVAANPYGPQQPFFPRNQLQRPSLLLVHGTTSAGVAARTVVAAFGTMTNEMTKQYQGWIFPYDTTTPSSPVPQGNTSPYITQCYFPSETAAGGTPPCSCKDGTDAPPTGCATGNEPPPNADLKNPCGQGGGVWMSARGPAANTSHQLFFAAGNGAFQYCPNCGHHCAGPPPPGDSFQKFTNFGEAVIQINLQNVWNTTSGTAPFWPTDYFVPFVIPSGVSNPQGANSYFKLMNLNDWDMGISGSLLFDDNWINGSGTTVADTSMEFTSTKRGDGYVLLQSALGQYTSTDSGAVARFNMSSGSDQSCSAGPCDEPRSPALWTPVSSRSLMVVWPWFQKLATYQWQLPSGASQYTFVHTTSGSSPFPDGSGAGYGGGTLAMTINTADSPSAAIVWALVTSVNQTGCSSGRHCPGYLVAYKLDTSGNLTQIWPSSFPATADLEPAPFGIPTVKNGKVYAPAYGLNDGSGGYTTKSGVAVYGFCSGSGCL